MEKTIKKKKKEQNKNKHVMPPLTPTLKLVLWPSLQNRTSKGRKHTYQALKVTRDSEQSTNSTLRKSEGMNSFFFFPDRKQFLEEKEMAEREQESFTMTERNLLMENDFPK